MVDIIGVNHCGHVDYEYYSRIVIPKMSSSMKEFLQGKKIGVEATSLDHRISYLENFFYPDGPARHPNTYETLFNPRAFEYFFQIHENHNGVELLDSPELLNRSFSIASLHERVSSRIDDNIRDVTPVDYEALSMVLGGVMDLYIDIDGMTDEMNEDELFALDCQNKSEIPINTDNIIRRFQLEVLLNRINMIDRDDYLLSRIQESDLDVAVVGIGHAIKWQKEGLPFDYFMEDTLRNLAGRPDVVLQPLDASEIVYSDQSSYETLNWKLSFGDSTRDKPLFMGLRNHYSPDSFFEVFKEGDGYVLVEKYGKSKVEFEYTDDRFSMRQDFKSEVHGNHPLEYEAEMEDGIMQGRLQGQNSGFMVIKFDGTPYEMMKHVYSLPGARWNIKGTPQQKIRSLEGLNPAEVSYMQITKDTPLGNDEVPF